MKSIKIDNLNILGVQPKTENQVPNQLSDITVTAGNNVQINGNTISATDTTYSAGQNISIDANNVISAVDTTYPNLPAEENGQSVSLVTTGEKFTWNSKQDALSSTQMEAVNSGIDDTKVAQIATNTNNITTINSKIPAQASDINQLADKEFVNSSIATNTANFIGTFSNIVELEQYAGTLSNNDYAFVTNKVINNSTAFSDFNAMITYVTPVINYVTNDDYAFIINANDNTKIDVYKYDISQTTIRDRWGENNPVAVGIDQADFQINPAFNRYKYTTEVTPGEWRYEYTLNNSSFTASQWAAINSGATSGQIDKIGTAALNTTAQDLSSAINELEADKQNTLAAGSHITINNDTISADYPSIASSSTAGLIKVSPNAQSTLPQNTSITAGRTYAVQLYNNDQAVVNVPWKEPTFTGASDPTTSTAAEVGQFYLNTTANKLWQCTAKTAQGTVPETYTYTWAIPNVNAVTLDTTTQTFAGDKPLTLNSGNSLQIKTNAVGHTNNQIDISAYKDSLAQVKITESGGYNYTSYTDGAIRRREDGSYVSVFNLPSKQLGTFALLENIFPAFSTSSTYSIGDIVTYNGLFYECTTAITVAGSWTGSTNWATTTLEDELKNKADANNVITLNNTDETLTVSKNLILPSGSSSQIKVTSGNGSNYYAALQPNENGGASLIRLCHGSGIASMVELRSDGKIRVNGQDSILPRTTKYYSQYLASFIDIPEFIFNPFSSTATYNAGDLVSRINEISGNSVYDIFYKCTSTHTGAWDSNHFTKVSLEDLFKSKAELSDLPTGFTTQEMETICDDILYPALPAPANISASGTTVTFEEVQGAESYVVYADGNEIGEYIPGGNN